MAVWKLRGGRDGVFESLALAKGLSIIGFAELPDLSEVKSQDELRTLIEASYPNRPQAAISNFTGRLWSFRERMEKGDLVVMPLTGHAAVAVGEVTGPYQYRPELPERATHVRPTRWLTTDLSRNTLDPDIRQCLNSRGTIGEIHAPDAEARVRAALSGKACKVAGAEGTKDGGSEPAEPLDLESYASDQIMAYLGRQFRGHDLARLVNEVLRADGYHTHLSPVGPDGGVDIIAGRGPMGFDPPRLCVQVKSSDQPVDVTVVRELQGVMKNFGAEQGLLVSWGGFKSSVLSESRRLFFDIRLWDGGDLVNAILENYERLSAELQAELPLKRVWALVLEEE